MNIKNVIFVNAFGLGDLHLSRGLIKTLMQLISAKDANITFSYAHRHSAKVFEDMPGLTYQTLLNAPSEHTKSELRGDTLWLSTWYSANHGEYMNYHGISFDTLYTLFNNHLQTYFDLSLDHIDPKSLFPAIDYTKLDLSSANYYLERCGRPLVFISNGQTLSGQANNYDLTGMVGELADECHGITFLLSNKDNRSFRENVQYTSNALKSSSFDLNHCSYLASKSDLIIGRSSGAFSFCVTQEMLFQQKKNIISFSNLSFYKKFWLGSLFQDKISYSSNFTNYSDHNIGQVKILIRDYIKKLC